MRRVAEDEVFQAHFLHIARGTLDDVLHSALHPIYQPLQPYLHHACAQQNAFISSTLDAVTTRCLHDRHHACVQQNAFSRQSLGITESTALK